MSLPVFLPPLAVTANGMTIRMYRHEDAAALSVAVTSSYEHLRPWMPWAVTEQTVEEAEALCRRFCGRYMLNEEFTLGIWIDGELAGGTGFHLRAGPLSSRAADIGMWIRASYAGKGLGSRALETLLGWGFGSWGWERLVWLCDTRNLASARVAEKNGLRREGTLRSGSFDVTGARRDTYVYAILRGEYGGELL